jgi:hypothetical protein
VAFLLVSRGREEGRGGELNKLNRAGREREGDR